MFEAFFGKSFDPAKDIGSLAGKVILVTGGTVSTTRIRYAFTSHA